MKEIPTQLTSVKVQQTLFEEFKITSIKTKVNLQKLVERAMYLYIMDNDFQKKINNQLETVFTGSL